MSQKTKPFFDIEYYHDYISPSLAEHLLSQSKKNSQVPDLSEIGTGGGLETPEALQFLVQLYEAIQEDLKSALEQRVIDRKFIDERVFACSEFNTKLNREITDENHQTILGLEDAKGRIVIGPKNQNYCQSGGQPVAPIPSFLQGPHVTLFGPPDSAKMAVNAMNSYHRKLKNEPQIVETLLRSQKSVPKWGADDEDSKTPLRADLVDAAVNLTACFEKTLRLEEGAKKYELAEDHLALPIKRFPGLALPCTFLFYKKNPIPLHLYDFALHLFRNWKNPEALVFYVPKLENEEEAKYIHKMISVAEGLVKKNNPSYQLGTVRLMIVLENPRAILRTHEIMDALYPYFVGASLGWHDYLASTARLFKEDRHYRIPVKADPDIVIKYIKASHLLLADVVGSRGGIKVGGMYGILPLDNELESASFQLTLKGFFKDVLVQMKRNLTGFWVAHPDFVRIGLAIVEGWRLHKNGDSEPLFQLVKGFLNSHYQKEVIEYIQASDIEGLTKENVNYVRSLIVADIKESDFIANNHPDEIRYNVFQSLQYLTDWLSGNGCVALPATINGISVRVMDDLATAERSRWEVWHEIYHGRFSVEDFIRIAHEEMTFIRRDLSHEQKIVQVKWNEQTSKWYPIAFKLMLQLMTNPKPVEFATELLMPFTVESVRNSQDPWAALQKMEESKYELPEYVERLNYFFEICGSLKFAKPMALATALDPNMAQKIISSFRVEDIVDAASFHGNIGENKKSLDHVASKEQGLVLKESEAVKNELLNLGNSYLSKFGFKFLISAKGKSAEEIRTQLIKRLGGSLEQEIKNAQHALWEISQKRLTEKPLNQLIEKIERLRKKYDVCGANVAINFMDHIQALSFGERAKGQPNDIHTHYELASLSKPLSAAFALEFFKRKNISINTPVNQLFSQTKSSFKLTSKQNPSWADSVTIEHLLSHSALNMHYVNGFASEPPPTIDILKHPEQYGYEPIDVIHSPGQVFSYSGGGFLVLEHLIQALEGKALQQSTLQFLASMGLLQTNFYPEKLEDSPLATGYFDSGEAVKDRALLFPAFAAGAIGTAQNMSAFLNILTEAYQNVKGSLGLSHDTARLMLKGTDKGCREFMGCDMGLGIFVTNAGKNKWALHQGANEGFRCLFLQCFDGPDLGKGFTLLCNADNRGVLFIAEAAQEILKTLQVQGIREEAFKVDFDYQNLPQAQIVNLGYKELLLSAFEPLLPEKIIVKGPKDPLAAYNKILGAQIIFASDQKFARAENLMSDHFPIFDPELFGWQGKIMDSWESVRHNYADYDRLHLRLAKPTQIHYVSFSTKYHDGNQPQFVGLSALKEKEEKWVELVKKTSMAGHALLQMQLPKSDSVYSEIKVDMYPDGGLSRLGIYEQLPTEVLAQFQSTETAKSIRFSDVIPKTLKPLTISYSPTSEEITENYRRVKFDIDYASLAFGGSVVSATNEHYGPAAQVISPFPPINMFDGLESARSRTRGHNEEVVVKLGKEIKIERIVLDFQFFVNNNPLQVSIEALQNGKWKEIVKKTTVKAFAANKKEFLIHDSEKSEQIKVRIYPDGGINRIHVY
ncbi:MAG: serine hydrolase [Bdellovibrionales bacterium]